MNAQHAAELRGLLVDGLVELVAQVQVQAGGGKHAAQSPSSFTHRRNSAGRGLGVLHGQQRDGVQPLADAPVPLRDVVVVAAAHLDRVAGLLDEAQGQAFGGVQHRVRDFGFLHELEDVLAGTGALVAGSDRIDAVLRGHFLGLRVVHAVDGGEHARPVPGRIQRVVLRFRDHVFCHLGYGLDQMAVGVDNGNLAHFNLRVVRVRRIC